MVAVVVVVVVVALADSKLFCCHFLSTVSSKRNSGAVASSGVVTFSLFFGERTFFSNLLGKATCDDIGMSKLRASA